MEDVIVVASYFYNRYAQEYGNKIDKMKLHKLMYLAQRESLIQTNEPLFDATFYGWRYGPVLKAIREVYEKDAFIRKIPGDTLRRIFPIVDKVFNDYAGKDSWSLSRLTHGEISWKNSRIGVSNWENSDNPISIDDIRKDAERVRERRKMLNSMGFIA